jgi:hypothetical protein
MPAGRGLGKPVMLQGHPIPPTLYRANQKRPWVLRYHVVPKKPRLG